MRGELPVEAAVEVFRHPMEPESSVRNLGPYGWDYYESLVKVECGDKTGRPDVVACSSVDSLDLNSCASHRTSELCVSLQVSLWGGTMTGGITVQTATSGLNASALIANKAPRRDFPAEGYCAGILKDMEVNVF